MKPKKVIIDNKLVQYRESGDGATLLCLHGWKSDGASFEMLANELQSFRVIALDLPNFGQSEDNRDCTSLDNYAQFIQKFIQKLNIDNYSLIGHSMGGQIAIRATASNLVDPDHLILIASSGVRDQRRLIKRSIKLLAKPLKYIIPKSVKRKFYQAINSDYSSELSDTHKRIIDSMLNSDVQESAKHITKPALLIYGSADASTPPIFGAQLAGKMKNSTFITIEDANHWLHVAMSKQVSDYIKDFITNDSIN